MSVEYRRAMGALLRGEGLARIQAEELMAATLSGQLPEVAVAAWLTALQGQPLTAPVLTGLVTAVRQRARRVHAPEGALVLDTTGTGGSGLDTLNVSTMAALVCAAAGVRVAKPCADARLGHCGSAEVLAHLGVDLAGTVAQGQAWFERGPLVWLPTALHHPELAALGALRAALGFGTALDVLAPLCNAGGARRHLVGVSDAHLGPLMLHALRVQGAQRAMVVAGANGFDEISLSGPTRFWELWDDGSTHQGVLTPEDFGVRRRPFVFTRGGDVVHNAAQFVGALRGQLQGPVVDLVALNAGAALYVAGAVGDVESGVQRAREVLSGGAAWAVFEDVRAVQSPPDLR